MYELLRIVMNYQIIIYRTIKKIYGTNLKIMALSLLSCSFLTIFTLEMYGLIKDIV